MTDNTKTFKNLNFVQDTNYPHEQLNQPPKYNAEFSTDDYTLSVVYGGMTYSSSSTDGDASSYEVALWDSDDELVKMDEYDSVLGWQTPDEITRIMKLIQLRPDLLKQKTVKQLCDAAGV